MARKFLELMHKLMQQENAALSIEGMPTDSAFNRVVRCGQSVQREFIPVEPDDPYDHQFIDMPDTLDDYLQGLSGHTRRNLNNRRKRIIRDFNDLDLIRYDDSGDVSEFLDRAIEISKTTYQWNLLGLGLRDREALGKRMRFAQQRGMLRNYIMECGGEPAAFMLGYQHKDRLYYTDVGYDPKFQKWGVGSVLQVMIVEDLYQQPNTPEVFDFCSGYGDHKARFGNVSAEECDLILMRRTLRNAAVCGAYGVLDAMAKAVVDATEKIGVKQVLKRTIRHLSTRKLPGQPLGYAINRLRSVQQSRGWNGLAFFLATRLVRVQSDLVFEMPCSSRNEGVDFGNGRQVVVVDKQNFEAPGIKTVTSQIFSGESSVYRDDLNNGGMAFAVVDNDKKVLHHSIVQFETRYKTILGERDDVPLIGNCHTEQNSRGERLYPKMLSYVSAFLADQGHSRAIITSNEHNMRSISGIQRAGFKLARSIKSHVILARLAIQRIEQDSEPGSWKFVWF